MFRIPPPTQVTPGIESETGMGDESAPPVFDPVSLAAHVGFGTTAGAMFGGIRSLLPASPVSAGVLYGGAVWAGTYVGVLPAMKRYPWPDQDRESRIVVMTVAHAVYGVTPAGSARWLASRQ